VISSSFFLSSLFSSCCSFRLEPFVLSFSHCRAVLESFDSRGHRQQSMRKRRAAAEEQESLGDVSSFLSIRGGRTVTVVRFSAATHPQRKEERERGSPSGRTKKGRRRREGETERKDT
jgi:hypothetical protein